MGYLRLWLLVGLSNNSLHIKFGFTVYELGGFLVFSQTSGMLSASGIEVEAAQLARLKRGQG
jgi:hypothetical protein